MNERKVWFLVAYRPHRILGITYRHTSYIVGDFASDDDAMDFIRDRLNAEQMVWNRRGGSNKWVCQWRRGWRYEIHENTPAFAPQAPLEARQ